MDTAQTTHISLCSGYGGIDLGLRRCLPGLRTVAYSEIEASAVELLLARMEGGSLDAAPIWTDLKSFPWGAFHGKVDILSGGYPCQPFSSAGKRAGKDDPRHLWPWIADGIAVLQPRVCFFENVEGHITLGLRDVLQDLGRMGYRTTWGVFSASEVGAPHQRKRVFILANNSSHTSEGLFKRAQEAISKSGLCGQNAWPSRPGQPQHAWEPPRVVSKLAESKSIGHSRLKTKCGPVCKGGVPEMDKSDQECAGKPIRCSAIDEPSRVVGNADCGRQSSSLYAGSGKKTNPGGQGDALSAKFGQAESTLGLCADESSSVLGETLTLNPHVANVNCHENLSQKTRARQILFEVWQEASSQTIQWETRRLQCFLAQKVLLSGMQLDSFTQRICYFIWCTQTGYPTQGWGLHGMWIYESCGDSPQGQEPIKQFKRELGYALCQLSYEIALEREKEAVETEGILQGVRESSERAWALSNALPEMEEVWRSALNQKVWEKGCYIEATSKGNRTDELRMLGNGVVPATAERAFRTLANELCTN